MCMWWGERWGTNKMSYQYSWKIVALYVFGIASVVDSKEREENLFRKVHCNLYMYLYQKETFNYAVFSAIFSKKQLSNYCNSNRFTIRLKYFFFNSFDSFKSKLFVRCILRITILRQMELFSTYKNDMAHRYIK